MKTMPYAPSDRSLKGEVVLQISSYSLESPWKYQYGTYLNDVLKIGKPCENCPLAENPRPMPQT